MKLKRRDCHTLLNLKYAYTLAIKTNGISIKQILDWKKLHNTQGDGYPDTSSQPMKNDGFDILK